MITAMTVHDLAESDGLVLKKVSGTSGGEYAGPCPACGGKDRFRCWPHEDSRGGRYWCRQCGRKGDAIQYLRDFRNMSFRDACNMLHLDTKFNISPRTIRDIKPKNNVWHPASSNKPMAPWQKKALALVRYSENQLEQNADSLMYLASRGLKSETIKTGRIGWNPKTVYRARTSWGLPVAQNDSSKKHKLWIPGGYVIPYMSDGEVLKIKIRISERQANIPPYCMLPGSQMTPMLIGSGLVIVVVESELDALLVNQESGGLVMTAAMGSAASKPDASTVGLFKSASVILIALDTNDKAGYEGWLWWQRHFSNARRWPIIKGKDPGEAWLQGLDIRLWVEAGIDCFSKDRLCSKNKKASKNVLPIVKRQKDATGQTSKPQLYNTPAMCHNCWAHYGQGYCCKDGSCRPCADTIENCVYAKNGK